MFCNKCGCAVPDGTRCCQRCGAVLPVLTYQRGGGRPLRPGEQEIPSDSGTGQKAPRQIRTHTGGMENPCQQERFSMAVFPFPVTERI